ncbi:MAG TPA: hypothetical protein GYA08_04975 [Chloroflexi bacterium]|nr:hypothetical protein [Chloroflexota bacterium]
MTFAEVDQRYRELKQQFDAGALSAEEFDDALRSLMIQDEVGRWWAKARDSGQWHVYDAVMERWTPAAPPPPTPPPTMPSLSHPTERTTTPDPAASDRMEAQPLQPAQWYGGADAGVGQPELSPGLKVVFYIVSFLVPIAGIVLFFVYRGKPAPEDRAAARLFLILGVIAFALSCVCPFLATVMLAPFV